jgi:HlyD family secretion protein
MRKRIVIILILVAAAVAGVYAYRGANKPPDNRIVVSGNIELTEVNIAFKTAGRLIERTVDEGDTVKKGQVIARLDRDQLSGPARDREVAGLESAESQLAQAQTSLQWEKDTLAADIEQRTADVASNQARLAELKNGARPQEKLDAQAAVDSAQVGGGARQGRIGTAPRCCTATTISPPRNSINTAAAGKPPRRRSIPPRSGRRWCWPVRAPR